MNTRYFLLLSFLLGLLVAGCQKDYVLESSPTDGKILSEVNMIDLAAAMQWYENQQIEQFSTRSVLHHPLFEVSIPDWETCIAGENDTCKTIETYLNILNRGLFLYPETAQAYEETGDERYLRMLTRLVVLKSKESNEVIGFYMTIVPSKNYLEKTDFKSFTNSTYTVRDKDLDGYVLYHQLDGTFINGWVYEQGKITTAIYGKVSDSSVQTRAGTMVCIDHFSQTCTDWYSSSGGDTYYTGTTCDVPVYNGSDCFSTGSGGGGNGGGGGIGGGGGGIGGGGGNGNIGDNPTKYVAMAGDKFAKVNLSLTMENQRFNLCVPAIMEYIDNKVFKGTGNQDEYCLYYYKNTGFDIYLEGVRLDKMNDFVTHFFDTFQSPLTYQAAIDNGYVIMTDIPLSEFRHSVVIIGYQKNGNYIYMNPEDGQLYAVKKEYFKQYYNFIITGIKK